MKSTCQLVINGRSVKAYLGETLVDAGLGGWVVIPHDCCSGQCDTCRVTVVRGAVDDQGTADGSSVLACQATLDGDAEIVFDEVPVAIRRGGIVTAITALSPEVIEVAVELHSALNYRPGQYVAVKFSGFPPRELSPTCRSDGSLGDNELIFHVRRLPGGLISTQLGATIRPGHRVQVRGPLGQAFLRPGAGPLILVAGGTGWAPIWSLARAARREQRHRDVVVIAGSRNPENVYMRESLNWLIDDGVQEVIATSEVRAALPLRPGRPTHYLPSLGPEDTVHVAGPAGLVDALKQKARAGRARCYADPFTASIQPPSLIDRVMQMLRKPADQARDADLLSPRPGTARLDGVLRPLVPGADPRSTEPRPVATTVRSATPRRSS
jgi:3-phenylpropionate/trans-cinnamate dioxygenase ferredoxin reductase subunit